MTDSTLQEDGDAMDVDGDGDCLLCCEPYNSPASRSRVACSAEGGCGSFAMCRLCVFRRQSQLENPFVVDDDTGDFLSLDASTCPQCQRPGAFREGDLPPLSDEVRAEVEDEARVRREDATRRQRERATRSLDGAPGAAYVVIGDPTGGERGVAERGRRHGRVKVLSGDRHPDKFRIDRYSPESGSSWRCDMATEIYFFQGHTTVGVPDLLSTTSGVIYFEVEIKGNQPIFLQPILQFGFSLLTGMAVTEGHSEVGVGDNAGSWGFDGLTGEKIHVERFGDDKLKPPVVEKVVGVAANLDTGMIALSTDGNWEINKGNGVKFEDERIKTGVFPCVTGRHTGLACRFWPDCVHAPPPSTLWDVWPKFEDLSWEGITEEARSAAIILGYTRRSWEFDGINPVETKSWEELSDREQAAGKILGYNEQIWKDLSALWKESRDDGDSSDDDTDDDETSLFPFDSIVWADLPDDVRRAAETLGHTPTTWDEDEDGPFDDKDWSELTPEQQRAAIVLGYDWKLWNEADENESDSDSSDSESTNAMDESMPYDHLSWDELPREAKEAAETLGHSSQTWNNDIKGPWDEKRWNELPTEQISAAIVLGYDELKWNTSIDLAHDIASLLFLGQPRQR